MLSKLVNWGQRAGCALGLVSLVSGCGGGGSASGVSSTPTPPVVVTQVATPTPPPPPASSIDFNTTEYQRSNAAVLAGAITAYQAGATGAGIVAAVIDSGVASGDAEFGGRIHAASADLVGNRGIGDLDGHGTFVSSILLGAKNNIGAHGVAYGATLLVARTDSVGSCSVGDPDKGCSHEDNAIARGIDLAVANRARVINISLGGTPANNALRAAVNRATAAGVVIVISAGNEGVTSPVGALNPDVLAQIANDPIARNLVIVAGALDASNTSLADFSNRAGNTASHYLGALGVRVRAIDENGASFLVSGTSFAAPVISGAVALLAEAFPALSGSQIVDLLLRTATDIGAAGVDSETGYGAIDIARAFRPQGQSVLVGSGAKVSLGGISGKLSPAMGDAGRGALSAIILDDYARAFDVDLSGSFSRASVAPRLGAGLGISARQVSGGIGNIAVSLSVAPSFRDGQTSRAIAGSVLAQLGPETSLAMGLSRTGAALVREAGRRGAANFIASGAADSGFGFESRGGSAFAVRHTFAGCALTGTAETGTIEAFERGRARRGDDYSAASLGIERRFGALTLATRATHLVERDTLLGARFERFLGVSGARTTFADVDAHWSPADRWAVSAALRQGWTHNARGGLRTSAWSFDLSRSRVFGSGDSFALRIAQPLRVSSGGLTVNLANRYDYATGNAIFAAQHLSLTPNGRELDVEALYARPLARGHLSTNLYWRKQPGHFAQAPADLGAAIRFSIGY